LLAVANHAVGLLSEPEARALEAHFAGCSECCREWEAYRATGTAIEFIDREVFDTTRADPFDPVIEGALRRVRSAKRATGDNEGPIR
jgi:anti-sigma factor RsiW